jgi:hypothetical protein
MKKPSWLSMKEVLKDLGVPRKKSLTNVSGSVPGKICRALYLCRDIPPNPLGRRKR